MYGRCEMVYANVHVRYGQSQLAARRDSVSHGERQQVAGHPAGAASHGAAKKSCTVLLWSVESVDRKS